MSRARTTLAFVPLALLASTASAQQIYRVDHEAHPGGDGSSWNSAFQSLQDALDAANADADRDEIWIREGVHMPTYQQSQSEQRSRHFRVREPVELYGGFDGTETQRSQRDPDAHVTILDGDLSQDDAGAFQNRGDNVWLVMFFDNGTSAFDSVVDGLTIKGGHNRDNSLFQETGGGIEARGTGNLVIRDCVFRENAGEDVGALWVSGHNPGVLGDCTALIQDCEFIRNVSFGDVGALSVSGSFNFTSTVERCVFRDNEAERNSGAMRILASSTQSGLTTTAVVRGCTFENNRTDQNGAGALLCGGAVLVESCRFLRNRAGWPAGSTRFGYGGAIAAYGYTNTKLVVRQCLFVANKAISGGALSVADMEELEVTNSTFYGNEAQVRGGAIVLDDIESTVISNSILWNDHASAKPEIDTLFVDLLAQPVDIVWCNVADGVDDTGSFSADPRFVDPEGPDGVLGTADDDFTLSSWSPCVDAGNAALLPLGLFQDLAGGARVVGASVDMGAMERPGAAPLNGRPVCATSIDDIACPCGNFGVDGSGCSNTEGAGVLLSAHGDPVVAADDLVLRASGGPANQPGILVQGDAYAAAPLKDGVLCAAGATDRLQVIFFDAAGELQSTDPLAAAGQAAPGQTRIYQLWYRNPGGPCGTGSNFSNGVEVDWR